MFHTLISKNTFDQIMTLFFRNLKLVDSEAELVINSLHFEDDVVVIEADVEERTIQ